MFNNDFSFYKFKHKSRLFHCKNRTFLILSYLMVLIKGNSNILIRIRTDYYRINQLIGLVLFVFLSICLPDSGQAGIPVQSQFKF